MEKFLASKTQRVPLAWVSLLRILLGVLFLTTWASNLSKGFYTPDGLPFPPWQAYSPSPEFYEVATKLNNSDFATLDERADLMAQALDFALLDSQRIWLKDDVGVAPHAANVALARPPCT